ncbi:MAG: HEAT repeat domain-containing protein [Planctomycetota bacterium]|nr:HEAT repeat domain-containing protein [Planctomycetota bacterium]MDI6788046.1 HEAT repeat domain-containing protein [Planctomycetota bacterium]
MNKTGTILFFITMLVFLPLSFYERSGLLAQEDEQDVQFKELYRGGIELVKRGKYADAYESFEKALRLNPSSDLVRFMIQETGDLILKEMLTNPDLRQTALRILEIGKGAHQRLVRSPEQIKALVAELDGPFDKKWGAINTLSAVGQRAVPYLIEQLADKSDIKRATTMLALEKIGSEGVLPLIEALHSKSMMIRQNTAIVLGVIKDERALPALKRVYETKEESDEVRKFVSEALQKITRMDVRMLNPAKQYYYELAEKYYYSHSSVMINLYGEYVFWRWNDETDSLEMTETPDFAFNELLSEECCYDGLRLDDTYEPLWSLLLCVLLAKYNEADWALQTAMKKNKTGEIADDVLKRLQSDLLKMQENLTTSSLGSRRYLYKALNRSLGDNNADVSALCLKALGEVGSSKDLPTIAVKKKDVIPPIGTPIVEALIHSDKRIRYAAAEALIKINPPEPFPNVDKVIPIINDALGESGVRIVLLIEPSPEIRTSLRGELVRQNCFVTEALSAEEGLKMAKRFPTKDLIILNNKTANEVVFSVDILVRKEKYSETVFDSLKDDIRSRGIPLIMTGSKEDLERAKNIYQDKVDAYLLTPIVDDYSGLVQGINLAFQREDIRNDSKMRALQVCAGAATALANLDLRNTVFPYRQTVASLIAVLENRPDNIRLSALQALSRFADPLAIEGLTKVLVNKENLLSIRIKTAEALASIFRSNPESITTETFDTLKRSFREDEPEVKQIVAVALGNANLSPAQRKELFELSRPVLPGK